MDPYCGQQADKLIADLYSDADYILYWDSDVIAIRQFSPADLMIDGKPRCLMTPYEKLVNADGSPATPWQEVAEAALCHCVTFEFMRQHPFLVPRTALIDFREYMQKRWGVSVQEYIKRQLDRKFSEFNVLHAWAYYHRNDLFAWWNTEEKGVPEPFVRQFWSWGGLTQEIRAEMKRILA